MRMALPFFYMFRKISLKWTIILGLACINMPLQAQGSPKKVDMAPLNMWSKLVSTLGPLVNETGQYVASNDPFVRVWKIESGTPSEEIWRSQTEMKGYFPLGYCWAGNSLIVSRVKQEGEVEPWAAYQTTGDTVIVDPVFKTIKSLIPISYRVLLPSPDSSLLAAATPTGQGLQKAGIDFYAIDKAQGTAKLLKRWNRDVWKEFGNYPQILGWSGDGKGVFVAAPGQYFSKEDNENVTKPGLYYISIVEKVTPLLPDFAWMVRSSPRPVSMGKNEIFSLVAYFGATPYVAVTNDKGIELSTSLREVLACIRDPKQTLKAQNPEIIALAPNGRIVMIQDMGVDMDQNYTRLRQLWAVDLKTKRFRNLGQSEQVRDGKWTPYGLLGTIFSEKFGNEFVYRIIPCPEALLKTNDPQLDLAIAGEKWHDKIQ